MAAGEAAAAGGLKLPRKGYRLFRTKTWSVLVEGIWHNNPIFGILALVFIFISAVYAMAVEAVRDYRAAAVACGVVIAWIAAFWFPLVWT